MTRRRLMLGAALITLLWTGYLLWVLFVSDYGQYLRHDIWPPSSESAAHRVA